MGRIMVGTNDGLHEFDAAGRPGKVQHAGKNVTSIARQVRELWTVIDGRDVRHTAGADQWVTAGSLEGVFGSCLADTRAGVIVGTSEARLFRAAGGGLEPISAFDQVVGRSDWYTPWGGPPDTRSISEDQDAVYVNVHVGGILRSRDLGDTWQPTIDIDADVHRVIAHPGRLYAACGHGLAVSTDRGDLWSWHSDGLHATYCRGVAVCGEALLLSASTGPGGARSAIYRGSLEGDSLERCREGLPAWFDDNIDSLCLGALPGGELAAFGLSDGRVFASDDQGSSWSEVVAGLPAVTCLLVVPS